MSAVIQKIYFRKVCCFFVFRNAIFEILNTCNTKLKLDKEVGGGDLSELCTITMLIVYPYA